MKARVKATGEIIEVSRHSGVMDETNKRIYDWYEIETIDAPFTDNYWEKLKHQYAGMAMQGILSNPELFKATAKNAEEFGLIVPQAVAIDANCFATALVEKLKSENNG